MLQKCVSHVCLQFISSYDTHLDWDPPGNRKLICLGWSHFHGVIIIFKNFTSNLAVKCVCYHPFHRKVKYIIVIVNSFLRLIVTSR